jgi:hypothetical protein
MRQCLAFLVLLLSMSVASAGPLDRPPPAGAKVLRTSTFVIPANGSSSNLFIPARGTVTFDYAVEPGKSVRFGILTDAQFRQASSGHKVSGPPLMSVVLSGAGSRSIVLERGTYAVAFLPNGAPGARLSYRATYRR